MPATYDEAADKLQWLIDDAEDLMARRMEKALVDHKDPQNFKPGIYKHYKRSGNYIALHLGTHHDTGELFVVYVCGETGRVRIREWATKLEDSWTDMMPNQGPDGESVQRFEYVGPST